MFDKMYDSYHSFSLFTQQYISFSESIVAYTLRLLSRDSSYLLTPFQHSVYTFLSSFVELHFREYTCPLSYYSTYVIMEV
jgi:hypothetical protein